MNPVDIAIIETVESIKKHADYDEWKVYRNDARTTGIKMMINGKQAMVEMTHMGDGSLRCRMFEKVHNRQWSLVRVAESGITDAGIERKIKSLEYFLKRVLIKSTILATM